MNEVLLSLIPRVLVRHFATGPVAEPRIHQFTGAVLFADISGFTALTESLAKSGGPGIEELTRILNLYFGRLIDVIYTHGGDIFKFAGDALLALWPSEDGGLSACALQAVQCAAAAQQAFEGLAAAGQLRLRMRIAAGAGSVSVLIVGGIENRWEAVAAGAALGQIGAAIHQAQPGEIVLSPEMASFLADRVVSKPAQGGAFVLESIREAVSLPPSHAAIPAAAAPDSLRAFVNPKLLHELEHGRTDWIGELRRVTVIFMHFPGYTHETPLDRAQTVGLILQRVLARYEASLNKLSVDDKGAALVAVLGLPGMSHEDDAARGVLAALELHEQMAALQVHHAIGITTGLAFCGVVGNAKRREYTVMGDVVNLAARLMQKAQDDILCEITTREGAAGRAAFEPLPDLTVKGKANPISVFRPAFLASGAHAPRQRGLPIIGRQAEFARLESYLNRFSSENEGGTVIIEGPAGIGKSRLIHEMADRAGAAGLIVLRGEGTQVESATPYFAWRGIFSQLFGIGQSSNNDDESRSRIASSISAYAGADWVARLPLVNVVLPGTFPENEELAARLAGPALLVETQELLLKLLEASAGDSAAPSGRGRVLILEDAQWLDSVSWALALRVSQKLRSILFVLSTRPMDGDAPDEFRALKRSGRTQHLRLDPLDRESTLAMVCAHLGVRSLPDRLAEAVLEKAEGNPLFCQELAWALKESGTFSIADGECVISEGAADQADLGVPGSLQAAITRRIDGLPTPDQVALKAASAIGRIFPASLVRHIYPLAAEKAHVEELLRSLDRLDILSLANPQSGGGYEFRNSVFQSVAYNSMLFSQRRVLHRAIAERLERDSTRETPASDQLLAWHWGKVAEYGETDPDILSKAVEYHRKAADQALHSYANREAVVLLRNALNLLQSLPPSFTRDQKELAIQVRLGGPLIATRGFAAPETEQAFSRAWEICRQLGRAPEQFQVLAGLWNFFVGAAKLKRARELAQELVALAALARDAAVSVIAHRAFGETSFWTGNPVVAREHLERVGALYRPEHHEKQVLGTGQDPAVVSLGFLSWSLWLLGFPDRALRTGREQIELAVKIGHPHSLAMARIQQAALLQFRREIRASRELLESVIALSRQEGFELWSAGSMIAHGWALAVEGQSAEGIRQMRQYLDQWRATGAEIFLPYYLSVLADAYRRAGQRDRGLAVIEEAMVKSKASGESWWRPELNRIRGDLLLLAPETDRPQAEECFANALRIALEQNAPSLALRAASSLCALLKQQGRSDEGEQILAPIFAGFEEGSDTSDLKEARGLLGLPDPDLSVAQQIGP